MTIVMWALLGVLLAVVLLAWLLVQVLRQQGRLLLRIEALERPTGALRRPRAISPRRAPPATVPALPAAGSEGRRARGLDTRVLLVHWSPECGFCREIAADLAGLQGSAAAKTELVLVSYGSPESNRALLEAHGLARPSADGETIQGFARMGTPAAYLLDDRHRIAKPSPSARVRFRNSQRKPPVVEGAWRASVPSPRA